MDEREEAIMEQGWHLGGEYEQLRDEQLREGVDQSLEVVMMRPQELSII